MSGALATWRLAQRGAARMPWRAGRLAVKPMGAALILPLALLAAWQVVSQRQIVAADLLPSPASVLRALGEMAASGEMVTNVAATARRVCVGFAAGAAAGTLLGAATGVWATARIVVDPSVQALRSVPSIAWVPLFILWFGIFEGPKVALIGLGAFFPIYLNLMASIANADRKLVELGRMLTLSRIQILRHILLPACLPAYLIGLRSGLGLAWMFVAAAELLGASDGLGYLLTDAEQTGRPERVIAAILLFAACGKLSDWALVLAGRRLLRGHDTPLAS